MVYPLGNPNHHEGLGKNTATRRSLQLGENTIQVKLLKHIVASFTNLCSLSLRLLVLVLSMLRFVDFPTMGGNLS